MLAYSCHLEQIQGVVTIPDAQGTVQIQLELSPILAPAQWVRASKLRFSCLHILHPLDGDNSSPRCTEPLALLNVCCLPSGALRVLGSRQLTVLPDKGAMVHMYLHDMHAAPHTSAISMRAHMLGWGQEWNDSDCTCGIKSATWSGIIKKAKSFRKQPWLQPGEG